MHTLHGYMDQIRDIYVAANREYVQKLDELDDLAEALQKLNTDATLTPLGKQKKRDFLQNAISDVKKDLKAINAKAKQDAKGIRDTVERNFYGLYSARPEDVDEKALELLKSGILTDAEIQNMADKYRTNNAMRRIIGTYAQKREGKEMQQLGNILTRTQTPHLDAIDSLCGTLDYIVGDAPLSGASGARRIGQSVPEITRDAYENAPKISWDISGDGSISYTADE
jgi:hypothetical protein